MLPLLKVEMKRFEPSGAVLRLHGRENAFLIPSRICDGFFI
jgi:hypothetical protein